MTLINSIIQASATAVAKVYMIGIIGFLAVKYPRDSPLIPLSSLNMLSKMSFHLFGLPLIYTTIASTLSTNVLSTLWFVPLSGIFIILISFFITILLGKYCFFPTKQQQQHRALFNALVVASTFPNIIAMPILIFPSLCEYNVVHDAFYSSKEEDVVSDEVKRKDCESNSMAMLFAYFFAWNLLFWSFGARYLRPTSSEKEEEEEKDHAQREDETNNHTASMTTTLFSSFKEEEEEEENHANRDSNNITNSQPQPRNKQQWTKSLLFNVTKPLMQGLKQTLTSPGFIAMILGFVTASIPSLQNAMFRPGGALRFVGSSLESMADASGSMFIIVVAASLVDIQLGDDEDDHVEDGESNNMERKEDNGKEDEDDGRILIEVKRVGDKQDRDINPKVTLESDVDNNNTNHHQNHIQTYPKQTQKEQQQQQQQASPSLVRICIWFILSRLILTPLIICSILVLLDCTTTILRGLPNLSKLVLLINSCLPGALLIVVILRSNSKIIESDSSSSHSSEIANIITRVYLPSYLVSIVTVSFWSIVGLFLYAEDDGGGGISFCRA